MLQTFGLWSDDRERALSPQRGPPRAITRKCCLCSVNAVWRPIQWLELCIFKGCVSLDPSKISKSGWWGLQLDTWQLCNSLWYGLINSKLHIKKKYFFYITQHQTVSHVQCFKSPSWPLRDGLDLWPKLIYTLSWESQHGEI